MHGLPNVASSRKIAVAPLLPIGTALVVGGLLGTPAAAQFSVDSSGIPGGSANNSTTENVDFADVDLDGDWDAAFADGGDDGNDQNRIWINRGGLQAGPLGDFIDETATRFPSEADDSRDIEFADIDGDGDVDLYVSNTAQLTNQGNKWWVNNGLLQGGTTGFYTDETATRWVNLNGPNSSISPSLLIGNTFIDWSCDCDFGDLDNDGDLDLVHSSYGGAFGGQVPTRIFLNDGAGHFEEFNPSGFKLGTNIISNGQPALWAEGVQQANTGNTTGGQADIASSALDIDVGDMDGDFDLDILHGARQEDPRVFHNRLEENGGILGFRDVSDAVFPGGNGDWESGGGNYEQEMADMDGDGDLDIYGLNWSGFNDVTFRNNGDGTFSNLSTNLPNSGADDNEGDFLDYDNDGDLDLFVANFSGADKLYRNDGNGNLTAVPLGTSYSATSLDADACDVDGDGDYDVMVAEDNKQANTFLRNTTNVPDTHAPYIPNLESVSNGAAAAGTIAIRAQVYDNAPYYITWYNPTVLRVNVGGVDLPDVAMPSSAGQIFRAEIPRNLVGTVTYSVRSEDKYGNVGLSAPDSFVHSGGPVGSSFGSFSSGGGGQPTIEALSLPLAGSPLYLAGRNVSAGAPVFFLLGTKKTASTLDLSNGLLLNVSLPIVILQSDLADGNGDAVTVIGLPAAAAGLTVHTQIVTLDGTSGNDFASSRGLTLQIP
ncbi:FG-GAP repeat domain-containing protein [Engelhardtia mirabilis]|uniref:FG-GAP repeat protein n=1 Tax=Engelhardtia mirabilis TaxID=2528011 RepID=A0A518BKG4_9BACT|nr:hypothetical protein Pla133_25530 [Planctomycetes bacterium Pla133]QDV01796.1 hypothetical protein Pla86_25520 [Planctomycetes bacterium Pla86]